MQIGTFIIDRVEFPGAAGDFQRRGKPASLVGELGRNYARYHAFLEQELAAVGRPNPDDYESFTDYTDDWEKVHHLVHAELLLRFARARIRGESEERALDPAKPVVGPDDRLVSVEER